MFLKFLVSDHPYDAVGGSEAVEAHPLVSRIGGPLAVDQKFVLECSRREHDRSHPYTLSVLFHAMDAVFSVVELTDKVDLLHYGRFQ